MMNIYETVRSGLFFNKFEVDDIIFVEYACPIEDESTVIWSQSDYLVHVLSGKKTWRTIEGTWTISAGQTVFIKKGAAIIDQFFDEEFCMLGFFISDDFIEHTIKEYSGKIEDITPKENLHATAIEVNNDEIMYTYYQSLLPYFRGEKKPTNELLILKMKELILNIFANPENIQLAAYLKSLTGSGKTSIREIMEANFCYNLSLDDYAQMCNRSLSSFKRDFQRHFGISPGKWLRNKRLEYSATLLHHSDLNISQIVFESGFEDLSHFSRVFKEKFGISPFRFRKNPVTH